MSTKHDDIILDPFGGSGTSFAVAELRGLHWLGAELGPCTPIIERLGNLERDKKLLEKFHERSGCLLTNGDRQRMKKNGINDKPYRQAKVK